jgi:hypothetical protein
MWSQREISAERISLRSPRKGQVGEHRRDSILGRSSKFVGRLDVPESTSESTAPRDRGPPEICGRCRLAPLARSCHSLDS